MHGVADGDIRKDDSMDLYIGLSFGLQY